MTHHARDLQRRECERGAGTISIHTDDEYRLQSIWDVLVGRFVSRKVPVENLRRGEVQQASGGTVRQVINLVQGIDADTAKKISQHIRDQKLKKVQAQIQGEAVRVTGPSRDDLQTVIQSLKAEDWGMELTFGNYR